MTNHFKNTTAETVYRRTYSRTKPDGSKETWPETVARVVDGNIAMVGPEHVEPGERDRLIELIQTFRLLPAGRHLKSAGASDYALNNCWHSGWDADPAAHFSFTLSRLAEGGGVGTNYSNTHLSVLPAVARPTVVHIVCREDHPDYSALQAEGLLSSEYSPEWAGAYPVEDSREGWATALEDLIRNAHDPATEHENRVYDVSRVRERGAALRTFGGTASGPAPFARLLVEVGRILNRKVGSRLTGLDAMDIDHQIAQCIVSGGVRRSARMSIMHWADPQIEAFIRSKSDPSRHWTTNISVEVDDAFFKQLGKPDSTSGRILRQIAQGMHQNGEPGIWNSSLSALGEPTAPTSTNPCGEITLNAWEPCCLGHVNLAAFVEPGRDFPSLTQVKEAHRLMTRFLIRATHAMVEDLKSQTVIQRNRRIGVGHLGVAEYRAAYTEDLNDLAWDLSEYAAAVDQAAIEYAHQLRIPVPVKKRTVAPTGSISKLAGVSGEGIHPIFSPYFLRRIRFSSIEPDEARQIEEYRAKGYKVEPCIYAPNTMVVEIPTRDPILDLVEEDKVRSAPEMTLDEHLEIQKVYQEMWADNAVSYTVNFDPEAVSVEAIERALRRYGPKLKGTTLFPEAARPQSPYQRLTKEQYEYLVTALGEESVESGFEEACATGACPI
ncbi:ribonucleoside-triphosphate reductase, adenosylcobalamin-dependent [Streptomyces cacaoi]|uniref:Adenosylcobalamin-dependent ribonucleoside-triphosphate reductase n=1 Tax=Streptomyces cacaoi TaxID=1898 RepID=A0A4Y3R305_STRCI|nr:ribonucleoside-triphosphate reductase, adenosylcobalamin-dependent [Streptomyces cacaoi]GEB50400.1 adenosylcobalamin-dependent ribonucleoside-triphosphate reductase [Streptomyces cacaoi]